MVIKKCCFQGKKFVNIDLSGIVEWRRLKTIFYAIPLPCLSKGSRMGRNRTNFTTWTQNSTFQAFNNFRSSHDTFVRKHWQNISNFLNFHWISCFHLYPDDNIICWLGSTQGEKSYFWYVFTSRISNIVEQNFWISIFHSHSVTQTLDLSRISISINAS